MKKWSAGALLFAALSSTPLGAQQPDAGCRQTPPEHKVDRNGDVLPEDREWDWGQCPPTFKQHASGAVVAARTLRHRPSKPARKEFDRGVQAWRKGEREEAERHFAEAVRVDSAFLEARIELGALYAESGQPAQALDFFNDALALEPKSAMAFTGKAGVLVVLNRPAEAEQAARQALIFDPISIVPHYMLGIALLMQDKLTVEAASHLKIAANRFPQARAFLESLQKELDSGPTP